MSVPADRGDYQTPPGLARRVAALVRRQPAAVVEPTCGRGALLIAALQRFPDAVGRGLELDAAHLAACRRALGRADRRARLSRRNFFEVDWEAELATLPDPLLIIGNPPWVTSDLLGRLGSDNLPAKSAAMAPPGLDPRTGGSNFDISEWMLWRLAVAVADRRADLVMLCKTQVARRLLTRLWRDGPRPARAELFAVDAAAEFGVAAHACVLFCRFGGRPGRADCAVHDQLARCSSSPRFGLHGDTLVSDLSAYDAHRALLADTPVRWRSGIKHDCARVLELRRADGGWHNGLGERVDVEDAVLYPLYKSAQLDKGAPPGRALLVTQRRTSDDPAALASRAPRAWRYLCRHGALLDGRRSRVYSERPRFSIFGVGDYSFAPYKVAISGFYKRFGFRLLEPVDGRPPLVDDTCYFLGFADRAAAARVHAHLCGAPAQALFGSLVFWDSKRPITARLLSAVRIDASAPAARPAAQ